MSAHVASASSSAVRAGPSTSSHAHIGAVMLIVTFLSWVRFLLTLFFSRITFALRPLSPSSHALTGIPQSAISSQSRL